CIGNHRLHCWANEIFRNNFWLCSLRSQQYNRKEGGNAGFWLRMSDSILCDSLILITPWSKCNCTTQIKFRGIFLSVGRYSQCCCTTLTMSHHQPLFTDVIWIKQMYCPYSIHNSM